MTTADISKHQRGMTDVVKLSMTMRHIHCLIMCAHVMNRVGMMNRHLLAGSRTEQGGVRHGCPNQVEECLSGVAESGLFGVQSGPSG